MSRRLIRYDPVTNSASGVWSLRDVIQYKTTNQWPRLSSFELTSSTNSIFESDITGITFTLDTESVSDGSVIPYEITGITQDDLTLGNITGNFIINNNTGSVLLTLANNGITVAKSATLTLPTLPAVDSIAWEILPTPIGQQAYTTSGSYSWIAPAGVTSVCVVCVGGGGGGNSYSGSGGWGGGGGGLGWKNNISVTPGSSYTVVVGAGGARTTNANAGDGGDSYFINTLTVAGFGGRGGRQNSGAQGGSYAGDGGGTGGDVPSHTSISDSTGGGGAGGYSGNGGNAGSINISDAQNGAGGGGGGGGSGGSSDAAGAGGGVGILGEGSNGAAGIYTAADATPGSGGSGGENGSASPGSTAQPSTGGAFGGGGGGAENANENGPGGGGAVRIIWGPSRAFPSTNTGDI